VACVLPKGSIGKGGGLKGRFVKEQYKTSLELLQEAMAARTARVYISMGVKPAKATHGAAAAATLQPPAFSSHKQTHAPRNRWGETLPANPCDVEPEKGSQIQLARYLRVTCVQSSGCVVV
jgi:hypothetical protein